MEDKNKQVQELDEQFKQGELMWDVDHHEYVVDGKYIRLVPIKAEHWLELAA